MIWSFLQVGVEEGSRDYTAFAGSYRGQFQFKKMPLGLTNSPSTDQEVMDRFIHQLPPEKGEGPRFRQLGRSQYCFRYFQRALTLTLGHTYCIS